MFLIEKIKFKCLLENKEIFETEAFIGKNDFTKQKMKEMEKLQ